MRAFIASCLFVMLAGCASGNKAISQLNSSQMASMIHDGRTSKAEIRAQFGEPNNIDLTNDGTEKWSFKHISTTAKVLSYIPIVSTVKNGKNDVKRELVVLFDQKDIVKKHAFIIAKRETTVGLLG
jgi:hypothetical protein